MNTSAMWSHQVGVSVELRGLEPLTFSLGATALHVSSNLAGLRRNTT